MTDPKMQLVQAALAELRTKRATASNNAHWLRDGRRVCGLTMRVTIGVVCMLREIRNPIMTGHREPTQYDELQLVMFASDEWRDECICAVSAGGEAVEQLTSDFLTFMGKRKRRKLLAEADKLCSDIDRAEAQEPTEESPSDGPEPVDEDWWVSLAYAIARKTGWGEHYILWELPLYRAYAYARMINIEHGEKEERTASVKTDIAAAMEKIKAAHDAAELLAKESEVSDG